MTLNTLYGTLINNLNLGGIVANLSCPRCNSVAKGGRGCFIIGLIIITFPIGLLFLLIKPKYTCTNSECKHMFQP